MSTSAQAKPKAARQYLRAEDRREQLLTAAAELVGKSGWDALGMIPLAETAGVSRQLVYEHFKNVDELHLEVTRHLFDGAFQAVGEALAKHPDDLPAAMRTGFRRQLELPRGARLALRELTCGPAAAGTALQRLRKRARKEVTDMWTEPMRKQFGLDDRMSRSLAWMMSVALWGLFDLVDDRTLTAEEAADFYVDTAFGAVTALAKKK